MPQICTVKDKMKGSVSHHAGHIIDYKNVSSGVDSDGNTTYRRVPVYCSGHSVTGVQTTGQSKLFVGGQPVATVGDKGTSTCPCDGKGYTNTQGSSKMFVNGRPVVCVGDKVDIHGQGTGVMTSGNSKFIFG